MKLWLSAVRPLRLLAFTAVLAGVTTAAEAQLDPDRGLVLRGYGAAVQGVSGLDPKISAGFGLGLEYRATERVGVELNAFTSDVDNGLEFDLPGVVLPEIDTELRVTPLLLQLDIHLTPGRKADFYLGPVVGILTTGDAEFAIQLEGETNSVKVPANDPFAWGGHVGVDVPIGDRGAFFTARATYLTSTVTLTDEDEEESLEIDMDFDPVIVAVGFGYRF